MNNKQFFIIALSLSLLINAFVFRGNSQYLPSEMKAGLKGKISYISVTVYYNYPKYIASRDLQVFDKQGRFIKAILYDTTNKISTDFTFQYDQANRLISYKEYSGKIMMTKTMNFYNPLGEVYMQYLYLYTHGYPNSHFNLVKYHYTYNKSKQPIKIYTEQYGVDKTPYNQYFIYNNKGQKIERLSEAFALTSGSKKNYLYNKKGEVSQLIETDPNNPNDLRDTTLYKYSNYDKAGNWCKKEEINLRGGNKVLMNTTIRKISYFK